MTQVSGATVLKKRGYLSLSDKDEEVAELDTCRNNPCFAYSYSGTEQITGKYFTQ